MSRKHNVLILGASYGSLLGTKLAMGGHDATMVCLPAEVAAFNADGAVTLQDIFDFLAAYFAVSAAADINDSGDVTVQDIFHFLAGYFAGC